MRAQANIDRFALLLTADVKLAEASEVLQRAGIAKGRGKITALRLSVARAMQTLQQSVYESIAAE
jgi:3-methyladenine DNA glycosylase Tag